MKSISTRAVRGNHNGVLNNNNSIKNYSLVGFSSRNWENANRETSCASVRLNKIIEKLGIFSFHEVIRR